MKNLLKILLILAFASPVFANLPTDLSTITDPITLSSDDQKALIDSLVANPTQYTTLNPDIQNWVIANTTTDQQKAIGINQ